MKAARLVARAMGCTVDEIAGRMSSDEFQGHVEDILGLRVEDEEEAEPMTPARMAMLLDIV